MSKASKGGSDTLPEHNNKVIPDYFGYYTREVADLFSQDDDDSLPCSSKTFELAGRTREVVGDKAITKKHNYSGKDVNSFIGSRSLFNDSVELSDIRKERLKAFLRQSVAAFTGEVDEVIDPVIAMRRIQYCLKNKTSLLSNLSGQPPKKKLKVSSSSSSVSLQADESPISCSLSGESSGNEDKDVTVLGKGTSNCSNIGAGNVNGEVNEDMQILLENDDSKVEETMKKYSDELSTTLCYMEQKLEELLDIVMCNCRSMTRPEKVQLRRLIQNLPPRNLDRVVEIIRRSRKPSENLSCDEIHVDLDDEDNVTLWRLYYYAETIANARKLCVG